MQETGTPSHLPSAQGPHRGELCVTMRGGGPPATSRGSLLWPQDAAWQNPESLKVQEDPAPHKLRRAKLLPPAPTVAPHRKVQRPQGCGQMGQEEPARRTQGAPWAKDGPCP